MTDSRSLLVISNPSVSLPVFQKMSAVQPVTCTIKPPVYLHVGGPKTDPARSGVCVVDVSLPFRKPLNVSASVSMTTTPP